MPRQRKSIAEREAESFRVGNHTVLEAMQRVERAVRREGLARVSDLPQHGLLTADRYVKLDDVLRVLGGKATAREREEGDGRERGWRHRG